VQRHPVESQSDELAGLDRARSPAANKSDGTERQVQVSRAESQLDVMEILANKSGAMVPQARCYLGELRLGEPVAPDQAKSPAAPRQGLSDEPEIQGRATLLEVDRQELLDDLAHHLRPRE
jgi:hypothetical protein